MWWIKFCARNLQCFWQYLTSGKFTRPKHIENEQACFTMVNFSISFKQILPNLQSRPAEGSRCHRGPFMVLFWCLWYTSTFTIVAKIVFTFSRGLKRRNWHILEIGIWYIVQMSDGTYVQRQGHDHDHFKFNEYQAVLQFLKLSTSHVPFVSRVRISFLPLSKSHRDSIVDPCS